MNMLLPITLKNKYLWLILLFVTLTAAIRLIWTYPLSVDSYTHFSVGEYILTNKQVPAHSDLSFKITDPSLEWITHSWMAEALLYMAQSVSLRFGIFVLLIPLLCLSAYLTWLLLPSPRQTLFNFLSLSLTIMIASAYWRFHPFIFLVFLQLLLMVVIKKWQEGNITIIWAIPLIFWLFANFNGGYIVIPTAYLLLVLVVNFQKRIWQLASSLTAGIFVSLLNPLGTRIWFYWLTVVAVVFQNHRFSSLTGALITFNQSYNHQLFSSVFLFLFVFLTLSCIGAGLYFLIRKGRLTLSLFLPYLPNLMLVIFAFAWVRFIPLAAFAILPLMVTISQFWKLNTGKKWFIALVYIAYILQILFWLPKLPSPRTPKVLAGLISSLDLPGNILSTYDFTGYVMYQNPQDKVLLDAQDDLLDDGALVNIFQPVGNFASAWQNISTNQAISTAVVSRDVGGLTQTIASNPNWALVYFDEDGALFINKSSVAPEFLNNHELHDVRLEKNLGFDPEKAILAAQELETFTNKYPNNSFAIGQLATIYRTSKQFAKAKSTLERIPKHQWSFSLYTEMGRLESAQGLCKSAEQNFLTALKLRDEKNYSRAVLDLAVLYAGCFRDKTKAKHYFQRYNSYLITTNEREKLHTLAKEFGIDFTD